MGNRMRKAFAWHMATQVTLGDEVGNDVIEHALHLVRLQEWVRVVVAEHLVHHKRRETALEHAVRFLLAESRQPARL
jgi:hypothetical protein